MQLSWQVCEVKLDCAVHTGKSNKTAMVWHRPASQPDLLTPFKQETRFGSQINGITQESKPAGKHLNETPPKPMPL